MIYIKKGIIDCELIGITPLLKQQLKASLSYEDSNRPIMRAIAKKKYGYIPKWLQGSGTTYLIDNNNRMPTGLLSRALCILEAAGEEYEYLEQPIIPLAHPIQLAKPINFWEHQIEAVETIKSNITGMVRMGTGSGKTIASIKAAAEIGQWPYLFIVNRLSLLNQAHKEYSQYLNEPIGLIGNGQIDVQRINIATIGTVCSILKIKTEKDAEENLNYTAEQIIKLKKLLKDCKFVVCDEAHHSSSDRYKQLMAALPNAVYRIGLSATPFRTDGTDILLEAAFGKIIYSKSASELIEQGILCQPEIYFVQYKDTYLSMKYPQNVRGGVFKTIYKDCVVENLKFNTIIAKLAVINAELKRSTLISIKQINHGETIFNILNSMNTGLNIKILHGKNKEKVNEEKVKAEFASGELNILISTLFNEGVDIPKIDTVIDAGGGASAINTLQLTGRAIRKSPGKKKAYIFMFVQPYQHLYRHSNERAQILKTEDKFNLQILDWENA
jgi:superfamily II DNA or RNA helicase